MDWKIFQFSFFNFAFILPSESFMWPPTVIFGFSNYFLSVFKRILFFFFLLSFWFRSFRMAIYEIFLFFLWKILLIYGFLEQSWMVEEVFWINFNYWFNFSWKVFVPIKFHVFGIKLKPSLLDYFRGNFPNGQINRILRKKKFLLCREMLWRVINATHALHRLKSTVKPHKI